MPHEIKIMSTLRRPPSGNRPNRNWGIATELDHRTGVLPEHLPFTPPGKSRQSHHFVNISAAVLIKSLNWRGVRILENRLMPPEAWSCRDSNLFFASSE